MATNIGQYTIHYSGGLYAGPPEPLTFASLGITAARIVSVAGGADYAELTVSAPANAPGLPFLPLARHDIYNPQGTLVFTGWLMQPARDATPDRQQQTFHLDGPMSQLNNYVFRQPWNFAVNPLNFASPIAPLMISRVLLNRQDYGAQTRIDVSAQVKEILDYAIGQGCPITYGSLAAIPELQPQEDEQIDAYCGDLIQRQLRMVPKVTAWWEYLSGQPMLQFSANDAVNAGAIAGGGAITIPPGVGIVSVPGSGGILIDIDGGALTDFKSKARYDLLVRKVHIDYQAESDVTDDGTVDGTRKLWATLLTDESVVENGSPREVCLSVDLRGAGGPRDPVTGLQDMPQEYVPVGLAAAIHAPFKQLVHSLAWSVAGSDVDWSTVPGLAVGVQNAGDDQLAGALSIVQQITRDIGTGTTSYDAGPATQLGAADLLSLMRFNRSRNAGRSSGGNAGSTYNQGGGPRQQNTGEKGPNGTGNSGSGNMLWYQVAVNGQIAYAQFASTVPTSALPGGTVQNPD